ncbi:DUF1800 domain-containing protein [Nocardioides sp. LS1]|uniref:DUF1800 domain-containing protein n=1 Tax=Nocardioides sp. LS1 TaxID=1027620 RepID=UPI000F627654|nr:DUF1800 domain-containing protein [Nocardioides sp. LS1]GCD88965.1 hypothetical protein NLS1_09710 [Nocardioides sp. LS1]
MSPTRRSLLAGAGTAVATPVVLPAAAARAASYTPAHYVGAPLLSAQGRHLVGRFSYGVTPALARQVRDAGGPRAWFEGQLDPASVPDPGTGAYLSWWPSLARGPKELADRNEAGVEGGWEVMLDYARWVLMRRMGSRRQLLETMTELWENHFNVPADGDASFTYRKDYGDTIRAQALGRFEDLLRAAVLHPAMLIYLDNAISTAKHPNENLGRELLELHTVGRGAYTEDDVKSSARILTGYAVDVWRTWEASYKASTHWRGPVQVMEFTDPNPDADGRPVAERYLSYLAHHPATAQRVARRLAVKFVGDDPPQALVDQLADVYLAHDTEIRPVLRALVASPAFASSVGVKVRDPGEDLVATYRALRVTVARPPTGSPGEKYTANAMLWQAASLGCMPFSWPRPDGQPIDNDSWATPSRLLASMDIHLGMAGGWWPKAGIAYHQPAWWVPEFPIRFNLLVDHLAQQLLHRRSDAALLEACCLAVDLAPTERITRDHPLVQWNMPRLLTTFLDSPAFLTR